MLGFLRLPVESGPHVQRQNSPIKHEQNPNNLQTNQTEQPPKMPKTATNTNLKYQLFVALSVFFMPLLVYVHVHLLLTKKQKKNQNTKHHHGVSRFLPPPSPAPAPSRLEPQLRGDLRQVLPQRRVPPVLRSDSRGSRARGSRDSSPRDPKATSKTRGNRRKTPIHMKPRETLRGKSREKIKLTLLSTLSLESALAPFGRSMATG